MYFLDNAIWKLYSDQININFRTFDVIFFVCLGYCLNICLLQIMPQTYIYICIYHLCTVIGRYFFFKFIALLRHLLSISVNTACLQRAHNLKDSNSRVFEREPFVMGLFKTIYLGIKSHLFLAQNSKENGNLLRVHVLNLYNFSELKMASIGRRYAPYNCPKMYSNVFKCIRIFHDVL